jgi:sporulation protein YlmC with PRC-barrel domain
MFKTSKYIAIPLITVGLLLSAPILRADHEKDGVRAKDQCSANELIGKKVKNLEDEDLGKVQDLIINADSGTVPYAIIAHGGLFGAGRSRTAVPLESLKPSADGKFMVLAATRDQLLSATRTATGEWAAASQEEWARNVDGFYGNPRPIDRSRAFERDRLETEPADRTFVRDPAPKGAEQLMTPADAALCEKICEATDVVHVRVQNGVTHIYGTVENDEARKSLEAKVRAVPGVNRVDSHLKVKNP